jgi:menaquinone-9 beta-reductase
MQQAGKFRLENPRKYSGHAYFLFGHSKRRLVDDRVLLIGDSAGLAYPQSGEGIRPAIESGLMAAEIIQSAQGDYCRPKLDRYALALHNRFAPGGGQVEQLAHHIPAFLRNFAGRQLLKTQTFCRMVVQDWFLHAKDKPLRLRKPEAVMARPPAA